MFLLSMLLTLAGIKKFVTVKYFSLMEFRKTDTHFTSTEKKTEFSSRLDRLIERVERNIHGFFFNLFSSFYSSITLHVIDALIGFDKHFMSHR